MSDVVVCSVCGKPHPRAEIELYFSRPDTIHALSDDERQARCKSSADVWILDRERIFLRGLLPLSVHGRSRPYNIGVWAEVSDAVYRRIHELWTDPSQASEPRMPGALANRLPLQPDTLALAVLIQLTGPKTRPEYYVEPVVHPLYREQLHGIDEHRALEYGESTRATPAV